MSFAGDDQLISLQDFLADFVARNPMPRSVNEYFTTDFQPWLHTSGFFPGAGGFFAGSKAGAHRRMLVLGTDFGNASYQIGLRDRGESESGIGTLRNLRRLLQSAGVDFGDVLLSNLVLFCWLAGSDMGHFEVWRRPEYRPYVEQCMQWQHAFLAEHRPRTVVFLGYPAIKLCGPMIYPHLGEHWAGLSTLAAVYAAGKERFDVPGGPSTLVIPHPSMWNSNGKRYEQTVLRHLRDVAQADAINSGGMKSSA